MSPNEVKVSVCVVTYNQEQYIAQCLQSLVDQETNFNFEVIVSDDCSTDKTIEIVKDFHKRYPNIIRPIFHKKNIGAFENFLFVHNQAEGEYVAHMDGDDYALPNKLQVQANYLDNNPKCNIVFHKMRVLDKDDKGVKKKLELKVSNYIFTRSDIIKLVAVGANSSKMYRSKLRNIPLPNFNLVDYTVNVIHVGDGSAEYCCDFELGVYRKGVGISGSDSVNISVYESLKYFLIMYPEYKLEINASAWGWFLNNLKYNKKTKWLFLEIILKTFSIRGLLEYLRVRKFKKELSQ